MHNSSEDNLTNLTLGGMGGFATGYRFEHKNRKFFVKKVFNITIRSNAIPGMTHYIKTESAKMKLED